MCWKIKRSPETWTPVGSWGVGESVSSVVELLMKQRQWQTCKTDTLEEVKGQGWKLKEKYDVMMMMV